MAVYDFSVHYEAIAVDDIKNIHKYLMKKNNVVWIHQAWYYNYVCQTKNY